MGVARFGPNALYSLARRFSRGCFGTCRASTNPERHPSKVKHKFFCFALEPSPCDGYFAGSGPPCVCGGSGDVISALSQVAIPVVPAMIEDGLRSEIIRNTLAGAGGAPVTACPTLPM